MQPGTEQPHFIVDEDAPRGTQEAFAELVALTEEEPDAALAIIATVGSTPTEIAEYAGQLQPDDASFAARTTRLLSTIFVEQIDGDVQLPAADAIMRGRLANRNQPPREMRRVQRIGLFMGTVGLRARQQASTTQEAA
jgi:hypothetical protein